MTRAAWLLILLSAPGALIAADPAAPGLIFLGRFHPIVVHLPIGLLVAVALVELRTWWLGARQPDATRGALLVAATTGAALAVALGLALAQSGDYDPERLSWHQWLGIALALSGLALIALHHLEWRHARLRPLFRAGLAASLVLLGVTGHAGGTLTHGPGYLTRYAPTWLGGPGPRRPEPPAAVAPVTPAPVAPEAQPPEALAPEPMTPEPMAPAEDPPPPKVVPPRDPGPAPATAAAGVSAPDFARDIAPILAARCDECHGEAKQKGGLRLDSPEAIRRGSKKGGVLVPGDPARSLLFTSVTLPADDPDIMPARGEPLSPAQIALIKRWIEAGAPFAADGATPIAAVPAPAAPAKAGPKPTPIPPKTAYDLLAESLPKPDQAVIDAITKAGGVVTPLSRNGALLEINLGHTRAPLSEAQLQQLGRLGANIAWLDLGGSAATDGMLTHLKTLPNLRRLHLERTTVGDTGLAHLTGLKQLEYLNLVGTRVSDAGLYRLYELDRLERVYLWQSKVTADGARKLRAALPKALVDNGP